MTYLLDALLFAAGIFVGFFLLGRKPVWRRILPPEGVDRGPNADSEYEGIEVKGERYVFTQEALEVAHQRAAKLWVK